MHYAYCLHKIVQTGDIGFSTVDYSRFKFGDGEVARRFGTALADGFIQQHLSDVQVGKSQHQKKHQHQFVVCSSPYVFIPTATHSLARHFLSSLNRWLAVHNLITAQEARVHRTSTYQIDYSQLDAKDRLQLLTHDHLHIDGAFVKDKTILFIDDIRITGAHEKMLERMMDENNLANRVFFLYFAGLNREATIDPRIENHLNFHAIQTIFDLHEIVKSAHFCINDRFVKYVLRYDYDAFCLFLQPQESDFSDLLLDMAIGNGYHRVEAYARNLEAIRQHLSNNFNNLTLLNIEHFDGDSGRGNGGLYATTRFCPEGGFAQPRLGTPTKQLLDHTTMS
jgi:hypothetical protein